MKKTVEKKEFSDEELTLIEQKREYEKRKNDFILYLQEGMKNYNVRIIVDPNSALRDPKIIVV